MNTITTNSNTNINYKEIAKRHMDLMNSELTGDNKEYTSSIYNSDYNKSDFNNIESSTNLIQIVLNFKHDKIPNIFTTRLTIGVEMLDLYDGFYKNWKEFRTDKNELYWYNQTVNKSTWENPLGILFCLMDNKIDKKMSPLYWKSIDDRIIKIKFKTGKSLYIDKKLKTVNENIIPEVLIQEKEDIPEEIPTGMISCQDYIKDIVKEKVRNDIKNQIIQSRKEDDKIAEIRKRMQENEGDSDDEDEEDEDEEGEEGEEGEGRDEGKDYVSRIRGRDDNEEGNVEDEDEDENDQEEECELADENYYLNLNKKMELKKEQQQKERLEKTNIGKHKIHSQHNKDIEDEDNEDDDDDNNQDYEDECEVADENYYINLNNKFRQSQEDKLDKLTKLNQQNKDKNTPNISDKEYIDDLKLKYINEVNDYRQLLKRKNLYFSSVYENELQNLINEPSYTNCPKELRQILFNEFIKANFIDNKKDNFSKRKQILDKIKLNIKEFIETGKLNAKTSLQDYLSLFSRNEAFQTLTQIDQEFLFNEAKLKIKKILDERKSITLKRFKDMLQSEVKIDNLDNTKHLTANYVKEYVKNNPIYKTIPSSTERNELIQNFIKEINDKRHNKDTSLLDKKRSRPDFNTDEQAFSEMLIEKIKLEISWEEAQTKLSTEERWKSTKLTLERKRELFREFMFDLHKLKLKQYKQLLHEKIGLNYEINRYDAQHIMQSDPRYQGVQEKDREEIYNNYVAFVFEQMDIELNRYLHETDLITKDSPTEGEEFKELIRKLNVDVRCSRLSKFPDKRDKLIRSRIKSLKNSFDKQRKGRKEGKKDDGNGVGGRDVDNYIDN